MKSFDYYILIILYPCLVKLIKQQNFSISNFRLNRIAVKGPLTINTNTYKYELSNRSMEVTGQSEGFNWSSCSSFCIVLYSSIYIAPLNSHRQTEALFVRLAPRKETEVIRTLKDWMIREKHELKV